MRKNIKTILIIIAVLLLVAIGAFVIWGNTPAEPLPEALEALNSDAQVSVTTSDDWLVFAPTGSQPTTGLIIYPGGRVDYRAYAPVARQIASQGYLVVIDKMPLNLAVLDAAAAQDVIAAYPEIERWVVGGHSLGGAMAANFARNNPEAVDGLLLWAAYPASGDDLSASDIQVASIYGTRDGLADNEAIDASRPLLPSDTQWTAIQGGNHAQFGWYGEQAGDNPATISPEQQLAQIVAASVAFLESLR
jgi:dienelactone hydrolase